MKKKLNQHGVLQSLVHLWIKMLNIGQFGFPLRQEHKKEARTFDYHPPLGANQSDNRSNLSEIGVGVYQGELVVFGKHLLDIPSEDSLDWEVCKPRMEDWGRIAPEVPRLLHWAACFLECEKQFYLSLRDSQKTSETQQSNYSRYAISPSSCGPPSSDANNTVGIQQSQQIERCPLIGKLLQDLECQRGSCPRLYKLNHKL